MASGDKGGVNPNQSGPAQPRRVDSAEEQGKERSSDRPTEPRPPLSPAEKRRDQKR